MIEVLIALVLIVIIYTIVACIVNGKLKYYGYGSTRRRIRYCLCILWLPILIYVMVTYRRWKKKLRFDLPEGWTRTKI